LKAGTTTPSPARDTEHAAGNAERTSFVRGHATSSKPTGGGVNIARAGGVSKGEIHENVPIHGAFRESDLNRAHAVMRGVGPSGNPLDDEPMQKEFLGKSVAIYPGHRSRVEGIGGIGLLPGSMINDEADPVRKP
jgi:hypothetical protein